MFDNKTIELVKQAIQTETDNAKRLHGKTYASSHEAFAVLKEEVEEAQVEMENINNNLEALWQYIKKNTALDGTVERIQFFADNLALEACQIAAVCRKITEGANNGSR